MYLFWLLAQDRQLRKSSKIIWPSVFIETTIYRKLNFTKNESTGSYSLSIKLNSDENKVTAILITDLKDLNTSEGGIGLSPVGTFEGMRREKELDIHTTTSDIKIKYLGEN